MAQLRGIEFGDDDQVEFVTVRMSTEEAAFIAKFTGKQTEVTAEAMMRGSSAALHALYETFNGDVFNRLYGSGVDEWLMKHF